MADTIVKLGDFEFEHAEVPEGIPAGGNQMIHVNKFVGGKRKIVAVGRDDDDITWTGIFFGSNASKRFRALDFMRTEGNRLIFSYLGFKYSVVIKTFTGTINKYYKVPYSITLTIIEDLSNPVVVPPPAGFLDALYDDIATLFDILEMIRQPNIGVVLEDLNQYLNTLLPNDAITKTVRDTLEGHITDVLTQITISLDNNKSILGENSTSDPNVESALILENANLYRMQAVAEKMIVTTEQTKGTANAPVVTVNNTNLYKLAAKYYGDASQWTVIADANGLIDPEIYGTVKLIIPAWDGNDRGGEFEP